MLIEKIDYRRTWNIRHQVMWPDQPLDFVKLPEDDKGTHYGLFEHTKLVSVISLFMDGKEAQFRKFATLASEQGKGYGTRLLRHLINELNPENTIRIWCNARADKSAFYERFGMKETQQTFVKEGTDFVVMEKYLI